jgi:hypothetical protein
LCQNDREQGVCQTKYVRFVLVFGEIAPVVATQISAKTVDF